MRRPLTALLGLAFLGCSTQPTEDRCGGSGALGSCLRPTREPAYYVQQAELYFDTLDVTKDPEKVPSYALHVVRWEWYPWLKLTAYGRGLMVNGNKLVTVRDRTTTVPVKDCRFFAKQPFARCYVEFDYAGKRCPIYEEFFFNDRGETTWVEAWSVLPGKHPMPMRTPADRWAERDDVVRLGDKVPTLGGPGGELDLADPAFESAAARDPELADLRERAQNFAPMLGEELKLRGSEEAMYADGCGWPPPTHPDSGVPRGP